MRKENIFVTAFCLSLLVSVPETMLAVESVQTVLQQGRTISGKVTDQNGEPIIGANVVVKGTSNGVITDVDGNFELRNASGKLVVSYIGYQTQEVSISGKSNLLIRLSEDSEVLDEVVVTGYGVQKKASLTSAISQIKGEEAFKNKGIANATVRYQV